MRWCENTLGAFEDAIRFGESNPKLRGIELDVQLTADGEIVLLHNPSLWVADGEEWVLSRTPYDRLTEYTGRCGDPLGRICPRFEDVLKFIGHRTPLLCEIKAYEYDFATMVEKLRALLEAYQPAGDIILHSFSIPMMERVISGVETEGIKFGLLMQSAEKIQQAEHLLDRLDFLHPHYSLLEQQAELLISLGKEINTWTINDADCIRRIVAMNTSGLVEGIMTDDVSLVRCL